MGSYSIVKVISVVRCCWLLIIVFHCIELLKSVKKQSVSSALNVRPVCQTAIGSKSSAHRLHQDPAIRTPGWGDPTTEGFFPVGWLLHRLISCATILHNPVLHLVIWCCKPPGYVVRNHWVDTNVSFLPVLSWLMLIIFMKFSASMKEYWFSQFIAKLQLGKVCIAVKHQTRH